MLLALIGLLLTVIWLLGGVWYVAEAVGFENLLFLLPSELGQMATGFLLPLVLLWLVLGYLHIGNRLRRLEETLWETAALRPSRSGGGSPAPEDQGWLDFESAEPQGRGGGVAAASRSQRAPRPSAAGTHAWSQRSVRAQAAPAQPTPTQFAPPRAASPQPAPPQPAPAEPPRRGGLASTIFSSRMRDRLAEEQGASPRDFGAGGAARQPGPGTRSAATQPAVQPVAPQAAASRRSAAKPPPTRPTLLPVATAEPAPQKAAPHRSGPQKPAAQTAAWQKPGPSRPPQPADDTPPPETSAPSAQETGGLSAVVPASPPEAPAAAPEQPVAESASETPAAVETAGDAPPGDAPQSDAPQGDAPARESPAGPAAQEATAPPPPAAEAAAPASKPVGFRHLVRITSMELNTIAMDLSGLLCRDADHAQALKGYDKGQKDVFFDLLSEQLAKQKPAEALKRLQSAGGDQLMVNYLRKFDALVTESKGVDRSGALAKSLEAMPIGRLNTRLQALRAETW